MRLYTHDDPRHREAAELLPWFANGTLEADEEARVEEHLRECLACAQELADLQRLEKALTEHDPQATSGLARIRPRLEDRDRRARWKRGLGRMRDQWLRAAPWLRAAFAVQTVALASMLAYVALAPAVMPPRSGEYRVLGSADGALDGFADMVVVFDASSRQRAMLDALSEARATIVAGPFADGSYTLRVPAGQLEPALARLLRDPAVRLAAPIVR